MEHAQRGDGQDWRTCHQRQDVLILILMEHAQRVEKSCIFSHLFLRLNPFLMEHAQRDSLCFGNYTSPQRVLILILMEHAQRDKHNERYQRETYSLNPYFNGTCSKSHNAINI